jgi:acetyltransferase
MLAGALAEGRRLLDEDDAKALLAAYGIPVAKTLAVDLSADAAAAAASKLGFPVALKILSPDISHKSDVGGVELDLGDEASLRCAVEAMLAQVRRARPEARLAGFTVQQMIRRPLAQELIVGASVDPLFGPVLLFGHGGTAVEMIADRAIGLPPLNRVLAAELVARTRVARLLAGYRNRPAARLDAIHDVLIAIAQMLADLPELAELDINPLLADADGVIALDARVRLDAGRPGGADHFAIVPYPAHLAATIDWNGEAIIVRPIRPEDEPQHRAFVERLAPGDLRLRFFYARRELPRSEMARLTQIDYAREMAFIAVRHGGDGREETLGIVRAVADPDNVDAEFAVIVRSDLKGRGLGRLLLERMVAYLASRGTQRIVGRVLRENLAMRGLAAAMGFAAEPDPAAGGEEVALVMELAEAQIGAS